jgi:phosphoribosylformylglycinamidine cyclo-ligase
VTEPTGMTYASSGVDYDTLDRYKRLAQAAAARTSGNITRFGCEVVEATRGESCFLVRWPNPRYPKFTDRYDASVVEGLGTKNLVADQLVIPDGRIEYVLDPRRYADLAQDTVAMIVNDMTTLGAAPLIVMQHLAVGSAEWFSLQGRNEAVVNGWEQACNLARCAWGPGETPALPDVIYPSTVVLSGAATGVIMDERRLIRGNIHDGDAIVMLASSGIHANGLTMARRIARRTGYTAMLSDGRLFGEALLDPTHIYVPVIEDILDAGVTPNYAVNITGHGWRKLMRLEEPFVYVVDEVPPAQPVFHFIQREGNVTDEEMYGNYNMGGGFAIYVEPFLANVVIEAARANCINAWVAGHVEKRGDEKKVIIEPLGLTYDASTLTVR